MVEKVRVAQSCPTLCDPWTVAHQALLSVEFSRHEYWSWLPFPSPGDLPDPGIKPGSPPVQADSLPSEPLYLPLWWRRPLSIDWKTISLYRDYFIFSFLDDYCSQAQCCQFAQSLHLFLKSWHLRPLCGPVHGWKPQASPTRFSQPARGQRRNLRPPWPHSSAPCWPAPWPREVVPVWGFCVYTDVDLGGAES